MKKNKENPIQPNVSVITKSKIHGISRSRKCTSRIGYSSENWSVKNRLASERSLQTWRDRPQKHDSRARIILVKANEKDYEVLLNQLKSTPVGKKTGFLFSQLFQFKMSAVMVKHRTLHSDWRFSPQLLSHMITAREKGNTDIIPCLNFPGGHAEGNETPIQTVLREIKEEISLSLSKDDVYSLGKCCRNNIFMARFSPSLLRCIQIPQSKTGAGEIDSVLQVKFDQKLIDSKLYTMFPNWIVQELKRNIPTMQTEVTQANTIATA